MNANLIGPLILLCLLTATPSPADPPHPSGREGAWIALRTDPADAAVYGELYNPSTGEGYLGRTPLTLRLDRSRSHDFYFVLPGHATAHRKLALGATSLEVSMEPSNPWTWVFDHPWIAATVVLATMALFLSGRRHRRRLQQRLDAVLAPKETGTRIGPYAVEDVIGEGAFAQVYRVRHVDFDDVYALKLLKRDCLDDDALARFAREMEIGRDWRHPNLAQVHGFGDHEGSPYLVMEYLSGTTLETRLHERGVSIEEALDIARQIANGVHYCHQRSVVHRDLKPANVFLLEDGTVRVLDFGVARFLDAKKLTATGTVLGTPTYIAPEQLRGRVDPRSDIYALGAIMFEMLTGRPPFVAADAVAVMMAHVTDRAPDVAALNPAVPQALAKLVARMLEKRPDRRFSSLDEWRVALDGAVAA